MPRYKRATSQKLECTLCIWAFFVNLFGNNSEQISGKIRQKFFKKSFVWLPKEKQIQPSQLERRLHMQKTRKVLTLVTGTVYIVFVALYTFFQGSAEGALAVKQLENSQLNYAIGRASANGHILLWANYLLITIMAVIWVPVVWRKVKNILSLLILVLIISFAISACGPPHLEVVKEIAPNETAYLVPLEGANKDTQGKFMSIEYLEANKVASKRVSIPTRKIETGRMTWDYHWIETVKLIVVDRAPVTREWTKATGTGTSHSDQAISVESSESIDFYLGITAQASIKEENASKFLYYFAGKKLADVMDTNVRGYVQSALWKEFGGRTLTEGKGSKKVIIEQVYNDAKKFFAEQGLSIDYVGGAEGLTFKDGKVQEAINKAFVAENDKKVALEEKVAQDTRNETKVNMAVAARREAEEFAKAKEAMVSKTELEISMIRAQGFKLACEKWNGALPSQVLPQNSSMLFLEEGALKK